MNIKKSWIIIGVLILVVIYVFSLYNSIARLNMGVKKAWGDVEVQYQRRLDLTDNLVAVVKGYVKHEKEVLLEVVEARSKATNTNINIDNLSEEELRRFQEQQGQVSAALGKLISITENYPDLKANQNFLELQAQIEGTENRIAVSRTRFNEAVEKFNTKIIMFPASLINSIFLHFEEKPFFAADEAAQKAPKIEF